MAKISFFTLFRLELGIREIEVSIDDGIKLKDLLFLAQEQIKKPFMYKLLKDGELLSNAIVLVNGRNVHHLQGLDTAVKDSDEIALFPPGGGG